MKQNKLFIELSKLQHFEHRNPRMEVTGNEQQKLTFRLDRVGGAGGKEEENKTKNPNLEKKKIIFYLISV